MVETGMFQEVGGQLANKLFSSVLWIGGAFIVVGIIGFCMWYFFIYKRKFNIDVKIISKRAKDKNNILFDKAAILIDRKDKSKFFKLWDTNVELPVPHFNILQKTDRGDYIEIYRTGEDTFYYLLPPKVNKTYTIKGNGKYIAVANQSINLIDPDMAFWATKRKSMNRSMFDPEKLWMKILPYIPHIFSGVLIIFILWILMSHLPGILAELRELSATLNSRTTAEVVTGLWLGLI